MRGSTTVRALAREAGLDIDDVLVTLWDCEFTRLERPDDIVYDREVASARNALGLASPADLVSRFYWCKRLALEESDLDNLLSELGFSSRQSQSRVPRGAVKRLQAIARERSRREPPVAAVRCTPQLVVIEKPSPRPWVISGHQNRDLRYLTEDEVVGIHFAIAEEFQPGPDPIFPAGVRDWDLLGSAVGRPLTSIGDEAKYPTVEMAAAALLHSLVLDHAFHNGNKRTGLVATLAFLDCNGMLPTCTQEDALVFVLRLAKHALTPFSGPERTDQEVLVSTEWVIKHSRPIDRTERPLQWREMKRALAEYDCTWDFRGRDNCMTIVRKIKRQSRYIGQRDRIVELRVQATFTGDGGELTKREVGNIRRALELDEADGIDSKHFYGDDGLRVDAWINRYRLTLKRLARL